MINVVLPEVVVDKLIAEAKRLGVPPEELAGEILPKELSRDPEDLVLLYLYLYKKFIRDAERLIKEGDYVRAS